MASTIDFRADPLRHRGDTFSSASGPGATSVSLPTRVGMTQVGRRVPVRSIMPKTATRRSTTCLVAVTARSLSVAIYAVTAPSSEEAVQTVRAQAPTGAGVVVVGSLSSRMAKVIRQAAGDVRAI